MLRAYATHGFLLSPILSLKRYHESKSHQALPLARCSSAARDQLTVSASTPPLVAGSPGPPFILRSPVNLLG